MKARLHGASVYTDGVFRQTDITMEDGIITALGSSGPADKTFDLAGCRVIPGLIDLHTHGGYGIDINHATADDLRELDAHFASHGTTAWLASILTDTREQTEWCIAQVCAAMRCTPAGSGLLGIHLEGPFLAPAYKGAMPESLLRAGDPDLFYHYQSLADGAVKYITVSPEVPGVPEFISAVAGDVVVALGHSGADYAASMDSIRRGARAATHTFNVMRLFHQHEPALMGAVLESDVFCEAICDGRHLHPGAVRLLWKIKRDQFVAVTDSIQPAGMPDGQYRLGVNDIVVKDGDAKLLGSDVRAGSTLTAFQGLKNLMSFTGEAMEAVLPAFTANPARLLGIYGKKGKIASGADADLLVLDQNDDLRMVFARDNLLYSN